MTRGARGVTGPMGGRGGVGLRGAAVRLGLGGRWREGQPGIAARLLQASSTFHDTRVRWCVGPADRWAGCRVLCGWELACGASGHDP